MHATAEVAMQVHPSSSNDDRLYLHVLMSLKVALVGCFVSKLDVSKLCCGVTFNEMLGHLIRGCV